MVSKALLANGIRVVSEEINHVRSVSMGVWVHCGSRHEDGATNGIAHFIEHMLFKGTENRSPLEIASAIDAVGGVINASTGKEITAFYVKVPDYCLELAIELLADILRNSRFQSVEIEREKSVIHQEIRSLEDSPDEYIHDIFEGRLWDGHPLARPIMGTQDSISGLTREQIVHFFNRNYRGRNLVISVAGRLQHDQLFDLVSRHFESLNGTDEAYPNVSPIPRIVPSVVFKELEQVHLVLGCPAPSSTDPRRYAAFLLNAFLGGSMSSRLFQEIREKRGLVYDIQSYLNSYLDAGMLGIYAATGADEIRQVIRLVYSEIKRLRDHSLNDRELRNAKEMIKGNFLLSMESTDNRMTRLAKNEFCFGRQIPWDEVMERIEGVSRQDIADLMEEMFALDRLSMVAVGRVDPDLVDEMRGTL
ncbi:MAG: insulinase family protein [Deltaproteobacteria bacterium]|nr:insulinase family protein [Deltaproteobacteria bacterium]